MLVRIGFFAAFVAWTLTAGAASLREVPGLDGFIDEMHERHGFERSQLERWFASVHLRRDAVAAMERPAEALPWSRYRGLFVNPKTVDGGVRFARSHAALLRRAQAVYGVAPEVIVAILGVESRYGHQHGRYPVLDTLTTMAFLYPRRADFFRRELEQYLLLAREEGFDPSQLNGSYAGAMGQAQFIASSYRAYAVDFDGDGRRDLIGSVDDAIGSVANYLRRHGWRPGGPVASRVKLGPDANLALAGGGPKPDMTLDEFAGNDIFALHPGLDAAEPAALYRLSTATAPEYRLGFHNFYVITRYNRSVNYAMAVYELASGIRARIGDDT